MRILAAVWKRFEMWRKAAQCLFLEGPAAIGAVRNPTFPVYSATHVSAFLEYRLPTVSGQCKCLGCHWSTVGRLPLSVSPHLLTRPNRALRRRLGSSGTQLSGILSAFLPMPP